jgi:hypothetical protein
MPYKVKKTGAGYKVTSPNHPKGFSSRPQTKTKAQAQQRALYANASETGHSLHRMVKK